VIYGQRRGLLRFLVGKPEGKKPLEKPKNRWEDNINMDIHEVGGEGMAWFEVAEDRKRWRVLVNA
jgi:hypothetical protein